MRLQRQQGAASKYDAVACYDRMIPALVVSAFQRIGVNKKAGDMLRDSLKSWYTALERYMENWKTISLTQKNIQYSEPAKEVGAQDHTGTR